MSLLTRLKRRIRGVVRPGVLVLMYHRVADVSFDPWELCVSPAHFEEQLRWLRQTGRVISMRRFVRDRQAGRLTNGRIVLTFDDGYLDNFTVARPLLEKYDLPATFFITTQPVLEQQPFWWDQLQHRLCETPVLPRHFSMPIAGDWLTADLADEAVWTDLQRQTYQTWQATHPPQSARHRLYLDVWKKMLPLPHHEQQEHLARLQQWSGAADRSRLLTLSVGQLGELAGHPLIDIGAHTLTHPALARQAALVQQREIAGSRQLLESVCNRPVDTFAYPYGNADEQTRQLLRTEGFRAGFTTCAGPVTARTNAQELGRFQIPDWTAGQLAQYLDPFF